RIYIQCKTMHRHPARTSNPQSTHSTVFNPYAGQSINTARLNTIISTGSDNNFLQIAHIFMNIRKMALHIYNRIAYNLSGSMVRNITTSVALYKVSFNFGQLAYFFQQMLFFPVFTQSINVWMLNKQKYLVALMFRVAFIPLYLLLLIHYPLLNSSLQVPYRLVWGLSQIIAFHFLHK